MHIDLRALEAKARAAKAVWPGPWRAAPLLDDSGPQDADQAVAWGVHPGADVKCDAKRTGASMPRVVAEHMAANDPDTVLMLVNLIKAWR